MENVKVKVLRAFYHEGEPREVGSVLEVSPLQARELAAWNKAAVVTDEPKKPGKKAAKADAPTDQENDE